MRSARHQIDDTPPIQVHHASQSPHITDSSRSHPSTQSPTISRIPPTISHIPLTIPTSRSLFYGLNRAELFWNVSLCRFVRSSVQRHISQKRGIIPSDASESPIGHQKLRFPGAGSQSRGWDLAPFPRPRVICSGMQSSSRAWHTCRVYRIATNRSPFVRGAEATGQSLV